MNKKLLVATTVLCAALAGCGGGGGSGSTPTSSTLAAQGVYEGTTSSGTDFSLLLLDNGTYYTLGGTRTSSGFLVSDLVEGTGTQSGASFTSSDLRDFLYTGQTLAGTLSATVNAGTSVSGTLTEGATSVTFSGAPPASSTYDYNTPANISTIAGNWNVTTLQGASATLAISTSGTFTGSSAGCSFSGTISPRSSGKNVFDVAVVFGPSPCALPNGSGNGIALSYPIAGTNLTQLLVTAVDGTRTYGTVLFGQR